MVITFEIVVLVVGFISTLIVMYSTLRKFKSDSQDRVEKDNEKSRQEVEWRVRTEEKINALLRNSEETKKNEIEILVIKSDIKDIRNELESIKNQLKSQKTN